MDTCVCYCDAVFFSIWKTVTVLPSLSESLFSHQVVVVKALRMCPASIQTISKSTGLLSLVRLSLIVLKFFMHTLRT